MNKLDETEVTELCRTAVPLVALLGLQLEELDGPRVRLRMPYREVMVRPGGTVSGPAMMGMADFVEAVGAGEARIDLAVDDELINRLGLYVVRQMAALEALLHHPMIA